MKREESLFLNQLIKSLEEAAKEMEKGYKKKDANQFNKSKKVMLRIQKEIAEMTK
jgi:hypothetical protein